MGWLFGRKKAHEKDVDRLLAEADRSTPPSAVAAPAAGLVAGGFRMPVEDVFSITGRGVVVTGRVESGTVRVGLPVQVVRGGLALHDSTVTAVEMFRKTVDTATVGDRVGLLLDGVARLDMQHGDVLVG